jgi:hypothetical protein
MYRFALSSLNFDFVESPKISPFAEGRTFKYHSV